MLIVQNIKELIPIVSNCMVIGDRKKFLSALICLRVDLDAEGAPTDTLTRSVQAQLQEYTCPLCGAEPDRLGITETTVTAVANDERLKAFLTKVGLESV